jgi:hypothetical protein
MEEPPGLPGRRDRAGTWQPAIILLHQGETDTEAFFVLKGRVVVKREEHGRSRITRSIGPGEQFGEVSALAGTPRAATAVAEADRGPVPAGGRPAHPHAEPQDERDRLMADDERLMISDRGLIILRGIVQVSMLINMFLLANEVFKRILQQQPRRILLEVSLSRPARLHTRSSPGSGPPSRFNLTAMVVLVLPLSRS